MTWGAHVVDEAAADALCEAARRGVGLSGAKDWRAQQAFLNPYDSPADQEGFAKGYPKLGIPPQSCCTLALMAFLREAGKDGTLDWEGFVVDVLRVPQRGVEGRSPRLVGDSPRILPALARRHGLLWEPRQDERPALRRGTILLIGGDDGLPPAQQIYGGRAHGILIEHVRADGLFETIEGGHGPGGVAIGEGVRELHQVGSSWWLRSPGYPRAGRMLRWWFAGGELPNRERP